MRIVLIGGDGFIGDYLNRALRKNKQHKVSVVGRFSKMPKDANVAVMLTRPGQLSLDNFLPKLSKMGSLKKVVYLSTLLMYPDSSLKHNEDSRLKPLTKYEKSKLKEEIFLSEFFKDSGVRLCIARLSNVYGDVKNKGLINNLFESLKTSKPLDVYGEADKIKRDFIFVKDAAGMLKFLICRKQEKPKEIFNVCAGKSYSVMKLIKIAEKLFKRSILIKKNPASSEKKENAGDNAKITGLYGRKPRYDLISGLKKASKNYLKNKTCFRGSET